MVQQKTCSKCSQSKDISFYWNSINTKDGLSNQCGSCLIIVKNKWKQKNTEKVKSINKKCRDKHKEKYGIKTKAWRMKNANRNKHQKRDHYQENKQRIKNKELLKKYGISLEEKNLLREKQNYKCFICKKDERETRYGLVIDHCHKTKKLRALLCDNCNFALGQVFDNCEILKSMIEYLSLYSSTETINQGEEKNGEAQDSNTNEAQEQA